MLSVLLILLELLPQMRSFEDGSGEAGRGLGDGVDEECDGVEDHEVAQPILVEVHDEPEAVEEEQTRLHFLLERHAPAPEAGIEVRVQDYGFQV